MLKPQLTSRERVLTALRREEPDRVPWVESYMHQPLAEKILGYSLQIPKDVRLGPEIVNALHLDNLSYTVRAPEFADRFDKDGISFVGEGQIKRREDLKRVQLPHPGDRKLYEPLQEFILNHKKDYALLVSIRFGLASTYLSMGLENFSLQLYDDPDFVFELMGLYTDWMAEVVVNLQELDIDLFLVAEDIAAKNGTIFSPKMIQECFIPYMAKVAKNIEIPWIYHSDGNYVEVLDDLLTLGMQGIANLEPTAMDLASLKKEYGDRTALMGNIDLHYTLTRGSEEETEIEVRQRIREAGFGGGYLLASSNGLASYCKKENVLAMNRVVGESYYPLR